ncbi:MAG: 1,4-dihydroxy-2-naphthoate polyprenyltransferase [Actinomycetota bacterium]
MTGPRLWVEAARPRTLVAGIVPVLVGTAVAQRVPDVQLSPGRFAGSLVVAVGMQVGVNFANDLFDARKGVDTEERLGPRRLTSSGLITPADMAKAMILAFAVAIAAGTGLAAVAGWELALVGAISVVAALGYSGGPWPYASKGLGEIFVFVFFGAVATAGSGYVQAEQVTGLALAASVPVGLLATAILVVNNLRDIGTDERSGKRTLAVRLGAGRTKLLYKAMIVSAYLSLAVVTLAGGGPVAALPLLSAPLAVGPSRIVSTASGRGLIAALVATARLQLVFGMLLAVGIGL